MKIILVSANLLAAPSPVYPLGLDYVAGSLSDHHDVKIIDLMEHRGMERLSGLIRDFTPGLIGLSLRNIDNLNIFGMQSYVDGFKDLMASIRQMTTAGIVLGGSGFTIFPSELMAALDADYGIVGDGEGFALLVEAIEAQQDVSSIPGVMTRGKRFTGFPDNPCRIFRRCFDAGSPHVHHYLKQGGILNLQTKRGCPYRCIYCTYPHIDGARLRFIDPADVAQTALMLQETGARYLFITDSTFNCSIEHSLQVAKAFTDVGLSIPWGAFFAPFKPKPDYFKIMAEAGLTHVEFGTESLCNRVLSAYGKPFQREDIFHAHALASDAGLNTAHYLLLGGPGEDDKTLEETFKRADDLKHAVMILFCGMRIYPHTPLHRLAVETGQIALDQNLLEPVFFNPPAISLHEVMQKITQRTAERPHWVLGSGGSHAEKVVSRMHTRGHSGPLWERLITTTPGRVDQ